MPPRSRPGAVALARDRRGERRPKERGGARVSGLVRALVCLLFSIACAPDTPAASVPHEEQSYAQAVRMICEVDRYVEVDPDDVLGVSAAREQYLIDHVKNGDGIYFLTLFRIEGPREQARMLAQEAAETKLPSCPLVAALRAFDEPAPTRAEASSP